ncbi:YihY/virulence factor BrkB family protein [Tropicimonas sp. IMCC34043]|uniref:YihY/virulence factor BrkB family protein n=1 Tax=Tropicimonas sp. IMCC34043 TaxID=2248760 RepID=UPI0013006E49|nr:YihY/virulence factor BrkB family protein [Tropicimonas sp. IMCC34043]
MHTMNRAHLGLIAAGVAFYGLMAVFPAITALVTLWGLFANPDLVEVQLNEYRSMIPDSAFVMLRDQVHSIASGPKDVLGWAGALSLLTAIWATRAGVAAMIRGLEAAYGTPTRSGLHGIVVALLLTIVLVGVALVSLATVVIAPIIVSSLPLGPYTGFIVNTLRWLVAITVVPIGIGLLYRMGPNHQSHHTRLFSLGSILATVFWVVASLAFSAYLERFGQFNKTYGSLGAVIAMLMWFYISAFVVLIGGTVNSHREAMASPPHDRDPEVDIPSGPDAGKTDQLA